MDKIRVFLGDCLMLIKKRKNYFSVMNINYKTKEDINNE